MDRLTEELRTLTRAFEYEAPTSLIERIDLARATVHHLPADDWRAYIDAIHAAIASGDYQKIVAARRCVIELHRKLEDTGFMARVFAAYPDCAHFAIRRERSTFLGATPEPSASSSEHQRGGGGTDGGRGVSESRRPTANAIWIACR